MNSQIRRVARWLAIVSVLVFVAATGVHAETKVTTVAVPDGGQPAAAKTDAKGTIHSWISPNTQAAMGSQSCVVQANAYGT